MSVPFRDSSSQADAERPPASGRLAPSQVVRNLTALEQSLGLYSLPDHVLRRLARRLRPIDVPAGATIVASGAAGDTLYLIEQGTCVVSIDGAGGRRMPIATLHSGELFGEAAVLDQPSPVSATAETECRLLTLDMVSLRAVVPRGAAAGAIMQEQLAKRLATRMAMVQRAHHDAEAPPAEAVVIAFYAPKGGSGTTTVVLNLAAELAKGGPGEVLVVDLAFPFTPAALLAGLVPTSSLMRASWAGSLGTVAELRDELLGAAQVHPSGFMVIGGVQRVEEAELLTTDQVGMAVRALRGAFKYVLVDLGSALGEITLSLVDQARYVVLVVTPELPSLKGGRDVLKLLRESLEIPDERLLLVLNQRTATAAVSRESVERTLGLVPAVEIRHDGGRPERAALTGEVLSATDPKSEIARGVSRLAGLVAHRAGNEEVQR